MIIWECGDKLYPSLRRHIKNLREMPCIVSGEYNPTLHHCRGGSIAMTALGGPGAGQKQSDFLQIPLSYNLHVGEFGIDCRIDGGVVSWENRWGTQVQHLNAISLKLGYSVWNRAYQAASPLVRRRVESFLADQPSHFLLR